VSVIEHFHTPCAKESGEVEFTKIDPLVATE